MYRRVKYKPTSPGPVVAQAKLGWGEMGAKKRTFGRRADTSMRLARKSFILKMRVGLGTNVT